MGAIGELFDRKAILGISALVLGLVVGVFYAWVISPIRWIDGTPEQLRDDLRQDYMRMTVDSYSINNDENLAITRYQHLGEFAAETLTKTADNPASISPEALQNFRAAVENFAPDIPDQSSSDQLPSTSSGSSLFILKKVFPKISRTNHPNSICGWDSRWELRMSPLRTFGQSTPWATICTMIRLVSKAPMVNLWVNVASV